MSQLSISYLFIVLFIFAIFFNHCYCHKHSHPIIKSPTMENVINSFGYPYENHTVTTEDGWILTVGRIPYKPKKDVCTQKKGTILMAHGIYTNGGIFVALGPNKSLGLILADMCYDIWLYNARGTRYSKHKNYTVADKEYWNFSFHELGIYDTSALLKHITHTTGDHKLHYFGYSQGTTQILALLTTKPEYQKYILSVHLVAPVVYTKSVERYPHWLPVSTLTQVFQVSPELFYRPFPDQEGIIRDIMFNTCVPAVTQTCDFLMNALFANNGNSDWTVHFPDLISMKTLVHYSQLHVNDDFHMFHYDAKTNLKMYGVEKPPLYSIDKLRSPVYIYNALFDEISVSTDVKRFTQVLPNLKQVHTINQTDFGHPDFIDFNNYTSQVFHRLFFDALAHYN